MRALAAMLAAAGLAAGCGGSDSATRAPATEDAVVELSSVEQITERFDADRGRPRLLLIFSPT